MPLDPLSPLSPLTPPGIESADGTGAIPARPFDDFPPSQPGLEVVIRDEKSNPIVVSDRPDAYVYHQKWEEAPQHVDTMPPQAMGDAALETTTTSETRSAPSTQTDAAVAEKGEGKIDDEKERTKRLWTFTTRGLILALFALLIVVGAIIGAVVVTTNANKSKSAQDTAPSPSQSPNPSGTSSPSSTPSSDASTTGTPDSRHASFKFQTFKKPSYQGESQFFYEPGLYRAGFIISSLTWFPGNNGEFAYSNGIARCSVSLCANETSVAWRGISVWNNPGLKNHDANYVHISCDTAFFEPGCDIVKTQKDVATTVPIIPSQTATAGAIEETSLTKSEAKTTLSGTESTTRPSATASANSTSGT